jgi:acyl-coenzyme A synthetase/AMP-(fatty) acid ligase
VRRNRHSGPGRGARNGGKGHHRSGFGIQPQLANELSRKALIKDIQTFVKNITAPYKYPRVIEFADALPKTISGKIRHVEIREHDSKK